MQMLGNNTTSVVLVSDRAGKKDDDNQNLVGKFFKLMFRDNEYCMLTDEADFTNKTAEQLIAMIDEAINKKHELMFADSYIGAVYENLSELDKDRLSGTIETSREINKIFARDNIRFQLILYVYPPAINDEEGRKKALANFINLCKVQHQHFERKEPMRLSIFVIDKPVLQLIDSNIKATVRYTHILSHRTDPTLTLYDNQANHFCCVNMSEFDVQERDRLREEMTRIDKLANGDEEFEANQTGLAVRAFNEYVRECQDRVCHKVKGMLQEKYLPLILRNCEPTSCPLHPSGIKTKKRDRKSIESDFKFAFNRTYDESIGMIFQNEAEALTTDVIFEKMLRDFPPDRLKKMEEAEMTDIINHVQETDEHPQNNHVPNESRFEQLYAERLESSKADFRKCLLQKLNIDQFKAFVNGDFVREKSKEIGRKRARIEHRLREIGGINSSEEYIQQSVTITAGMNAVRAHRIAARCIIMLVSADIDRCWDANNYGNHLPDRLNPNQVYNYIDLQGQEFQTLIIQTYDFNEQTCETAIFG